MSTPEPPVIEVGTPPVLATPLPSQELKPPVKPPRRKSMKVDWRVTMKDRLDESRVDLSAVAMPYFAEGDKVQCAIHLRDTLGLPKSRWSNKKIRKLEQMGLFAYAQTAGRILMNVGFDSIPQIETAFQVLSGMISDPTLKPQERIYCAEAIASTAKALRDMMTQVMDLAVLSQQTGKMAAEKPKNLPPQFNLQVNANGPVSVAAKSGGVQSQVESPPER